MYSYHSYKPSNTHEYVDTRRVDPKPEFLDESVIISLLKLDGTKLRGISIANFAEYISVKYLFKGPYRGAMSEWIAKKTKSTLRVLYIWEGDVSVAHRAHNESMRALHGAMDGSEIPVMELCVNYEPNRLADGPPKHDNGKYTKIYGCNGDGDVRNYEGYKSIISDIRTACPLKNGNILDRTPIDMIVVKHPAMLPVGLETLRTGGMMVVYNFDPAKNHCYMEMEECLNAAHKLFGSIIHLFTSCKYIPIGSTGILVLESFKTTSVAALKKPTFGVPDPEKSTDTGHTIWKVFGDSIIEESSHITAFSSGDPYFTNWYKKYIIDE